MEVVTHSGLTLCRCALLEFQSYAVLYLLCGPDLIQPTARRVRTQADGVTWNRSRSGGSGGSRHGQQTSSPPVKLAFLGFLFGSAEQTSDENAEGTENTGRNNTVTLSPLEEAIRESDRLDREYDVSWIFFLCAF